MLVDPQKNKWQKSRQWWLSLSPLPFIIITNLLMIGLTFLTTPILLLLGMNPEVDIGGPDFSDFSLPAIIALAVIVAPIIETLIFQMLPIKILTKWLDIHIVILISAFLFALAHADYSIWYALLIFPMGVVLAYIYYNYKHPMINGFWITTLVHAFRNMIALLPILAESH